MLRGMYYYVLSLKLFSTSGPTPPCPPPPHTHFFFKKTFFVAWALHLHGSDRYGSKKSMYVWSRTKLDRTGS